MNEINVAPIEQTTQEVNLWRAIRWHWVPAMLIAAGVFAVVAYQTFRETPKYKSESLILVANQTAVSVVRTDDVSANEDKNDLATDIEILKSPTLLEKVLKKLADPYKNLSIQDIASNLSLTQAQNINVLIVTYTDSDPQRAKAVLEALVSTYVNYSKESQRSPVTNAIRFIEAKLPEARDKLNRSSVALSTFRRKNNTDNPDAEAALAFKIKQDLQQQVEQSRIALNQTQQLYQELQRQMAQAGQMPKTALTDSVLSQDNTYQYLVGQLKAIEVQYALEGTRYQPNNPIMQELKDRRDELRRLLHEQTQQVIGTKQSPAADKTLARGAIQQSLANQLLQTESNLQTQSTQLNDIRQLQAQAALNFQRIVQLQQEYKEIQRQYEFNSQAVDNFLAKLQELKIREAQEISSWKVLEAPYLPTVPVSPNLKRGLLIGAVAGILLGVGVAFILEQIDQRLKGLQEVRKLTDLPLLGTLPKVNPKALSSNDLQSEPSEHSDQFTEAFRSLALTLAFQKASQQSNEQGKLLAVTSSISGEGKTTVTCNLGLALAELGHRVLIVDAALNQPAIHKVFKLSNATGLSTVITTNIFWQEIVQSGRSRSLDIPSDSRRSSDRFPVFSQTRTFNDAIPILARYLISSAASRTAHEENRITEQNEGLVIRYPDIMTSGPLPSCSIAWLTSEKMHQLLTQWQQTYDYVLIDTPPIAELADARSLIPKVDGAILVVGLERATRPILTRTTEMLREIQGNVAGLVVNGLSQEEAGYYRPSPDSSTLTKGVKRLASKFRESLSPFGYLFW